MVRMVMRCVCQCVWVMDGNGEVGDKVLVKMGWVDLCDGLNY